MDGDPPGTSPSCLTAFPQAPTGSFPLGLARPPQSPLYKRLVALSGSPNVPVPNPVPLSARSEIPPYCFKGTERHELTSWRSHASVFRFFAEALEAKRRSGKTAPTRRSQRIRYDEL